MTGYVPRVVSLAGLLSLVLVAGCGSSEKDDDSRQQEPDAGAMQPADDASGGDDADTHSDTAGTGEESPADAEQADGGATSDGRGTGEVDAAGDGGASNDNPMGNTRRKMSANGEFFVAYEPMPSPIPLNNLFELRLELYESADMQTSIEGADVEIEARMPEHDHGMNTAPKITEKSNGVYLVEGMKFHMPGTEEAEWVITVTVAEENAIDEVTFEVLTAEQ